MENFNNNIDLSDLITVPIILNIIKNINSNAKIYYHGLKIDYHFKLNNGCTLNQIDELENKNYKLPIDYREFLLYTNGLRLSNAVSARLLDVEEIYEREEICNIYPENILIIGVLCEGTVHILIDLTSPPNENIYIHDVMCDKHLNSLNCGFTEFLNRFIITYGSPFWEWSKSTKPPIIIP